MKISLKSFRDNRKRELPFEYELDLSALELGGEHLFPDPVSVKGVLSDASDVPFIMIDVKAPVKTRCARCLKPIAFEHDMQFTAVVTDDQQTEDIEAVITDENGDIDVDQIVSVSLMLDMDMVYLCRDDCKGLCPKCGKDLNDGPCDCKDDPDPRLEKLRELLDR